MSHTNNRCTVGTVGKGTVGKGTVGRGTVGRGTVDRGNVGKLYLWPLQEWRKNVEDSVRCQNEKLGDLSVK